MKTIHLIWKEILHRRLNFLLSLLAVLVAAAFFVFFLTTGEASKRETTRLMRDMGFNLRIVHKDTDMEKFWADGYSERDMPEEYVQRFANEPGLSYNHLLAVLLKKLRWQGREILLNGISAEVAPPGKKKSPMIFSIDPGTVYLGFEIARSLGIRKGDRLEILGRTFEAAHCLAESGTRDDITIYGALEDVQDLLGMKGRINEIKALECLCRDPVEDSITLLKKQLALLIPDARVIQIKNIAAAREKQRLMVEDYFAWTLPIVLAACAVWIGVLALINVRERRQEIGILRALGHGSGRIGLLFLGKAVIIGILGAAAGYAAGTALALWFGPEVFKVTAKGIKPLPGLLGFAVIAAPAFAAFSSLIPAMLAMIQDPAATLREE